MAELDNKTRLEKINLDPKVIENTLANANVTANVIATLKEAEVTECDKKLGNLLYQIATRITGSSLKYRATLAKYCATDKIDGPAKLELAITYLKKLKGAEIDTADFDKSIGVGVVVTEADIDKTINEIIDKHREEFKKERYSINYGDYLRKVREAHPFGDGALITKKWNGAIEDLLGPKTEDDLKAIAESKKGKGGKKDKAAAKEGKKEEAKKEEVFVETKRDKLSKLVARDLSTALNTPELLKKHLEFSGGKVLTRFPPEPNGYIHIGHAKSIRFNFTLASEYGGETYLRYDDTNPEKENQEYIDSIRKNVEWLGYKPWKVTHSSDYFEDLYNFAVVLIKKGKAYVCEQTPEEMKEARNNLLPSPYRNRPIEENLKMFEGMRMGLYEEGKVCLRLKIDYANNNPTLRDPPAYRIRYTPHPHSGNKWCIYPLYDFTHCICDSIENITHSCCTLEFEIRRDLYYWILEQLEIYRPYVWEFSRLNISNTVISKRKLLYLVNSGIVRGWDDPRLMTLDGLRRRGVTPAAINDFCDEVSVTRSGNENVLSIKLLEFFIRKDLDSKAKRVFAVLEPVKLIIEDVDDKFAETSDACHFPKEGKEAGTYPITLTKELWVDKSDVRAVDSKEFFAFAPGKLVGLKYSHAVSVTEVRTNNEGECYEVRAKLVKNPETKPKTYLNWVSCKEALTCTVNLYDLLFKDNNPNELEDWKSGINKDSLKVLNNAKVHNSILGAKHLENFQFERIGYFTVDLDSDVEKGHYVFNKTVGLQEKDKVKALGKK